MDLLEALRNGYLIADQSLLENNGDNVYTFVDFADVSYKVVGVVDPSTGQEISLKRAISDGIIDKSNGLYRYDNLQL